MKKFFGLFKKKKKKEKSILDDSDGLLLLYKVAEKLFDYFHAIDDVSDFSIKKDEDLKTFKDYYKENYLKQ